MTCTRKIHMHKAERGLFDLGRGQPLVITHTGPDEHATLILSVEGLSDESLARLTGLGDGPPRLLITPFRASALGLGSIPPERANGHRMEREMNGAVALTLPAAVDPAQILRLASVLGAETHDGTEVRPVREAERAALVLARAGRLLPAVVAVPLSHPLDGEVGALVRDGDLLRVDSEEILALARRPGVAVIYVSEAPVPLESTETAHFVLFRESNGLREHVAILVGDRDEWPDPLPIRLHSACLTGDLFGSLRCDCGEQLRQGLRVIAEAGGGILLYLAQEGRSIGLGNKLRAYTMQEAGLDTVDADCALGFGADERNYDAAIAMLHHLNVPRVEILTNNPEKMRALKEGGIQVAGRRALHGELNRHNLPYVSAKVHRAGHWLASMVSEPLPPQR